MNRYANGSAKQGVGVLDAAPDFSEIAAAVARIDVATLTPCGTCDVCICLESQPSDEVTQ
jgi:hypothetical protein